MHFDSVRSFALGEMEGQTIIALRAKNSGLYLWWNKKGNTGWKHIGAKDGLISSSINHIAAYGRRFYIAADKGLSVVTLMPGNTYTVDNSINESLIPIA